MKLPDSDFILGGFFSLCLCLVLGRGGLAGLEEGRQSQELIIIIIITTFKCGPGADEVRLHGSPGRAGGCTAHIVDGGKPKKTKMRVSTRFCLLCVHKRL
ncbi:hypothetical protein CHARACLAT_011901 [Characodon lateralis]|uniref:Secreted protein n=1 Tax=Characodon lateralis TaxID=208331 RepID=A0ABU7DJN0_9TELE|nr:hypothetical protein [Characodon lateralis]